MCMRTNIDIDNGVLREAQRLLGTRTKRDTVNLALRELVARHRQIGVLDLRGKVHWEATWLRAVAVGRDRCRHQRLD